MLRQRIAEHGPISFRDFMQAALYHPQHGYYTTLRGFGAEGDFVTSPEVHPVFGALLARQAADTWQALGRPRPYRVLEVGGGSGALAHALLTAVHEDAADLWGVVQYTLDEASPSLRAVQMERLGSFPNVDWGAGQRAHLVLANEVLDALPAHRFVVREGRLRELRVDAAPEGFGWVEADPPPAGLAYFERLGRLPAEGGVAEVNLGLADWLASLAARVERGLALLVDYGHTAEDLLSRPQGTLLTYYRHTLGSDPLVHVGQQDVSVHVDFSTAAWAAQQAGFAVLGLVSQASLLANLGIQQYAARLPDATDRRALALLRDPAGLGRIGALFLGKGLPGYQPAGLTGNATWPAPGWLPRLPPEPPPEGFLDLWREAFGDAES